MRSCSDDIADIVPTTRHKMLTWSQADGVRAGPPTPVVLLTPKQAGPGLTARAANVGPHLDLRSHRDALETIND
jgi:hypothetical protein